MTFDPGPVSASPGRGSGGPTLAADSLHSLITTLHSMKSQSGGNKGQKKTFRNPFIIQITQQDNNFTKESKVVEDISDEYFLKSNS